MKDCVIFAGGNMEDMSFIDVSEISENCGMIICADSGYNYAAELGIVPDMVVGDFDSYSGEIPENIEIIRSVPEKDDTDTILALKLAIEYGYKKIRLYGGLGARFDHAFANIQTMIYAREHDCELEILDSENEMTLCGTGEYEYKRRDGWYLSLFSLTENAEISMLYGVKYPLINKILSHGFPLGVSNEITENKAFLRVGYGLVLVVRSKM